MRWKTLAASAALALTVTACPVDPGTPPATTSTTTSTTSTTTTTTLPIRPTLAYSGTVDKTLGCFSGLLGDDTVEQVLGAHGWWNFGFQGCSLGATETVALVEGDSGSPFADEFRAPTGYRCRLAISGTTDGTGYLTDSVGGPADTGGLIFLSSSSAWPTTTTWQISCLDVRTPLPS